MHDKDNSCASQDKLKLEKQLFDKRASEIAKVTHKDSSSEGDSHIVFRLGLAQEEQYAMAYNVLEKVIPAQSVTAIPNMPDYLLGVTYYNAEIWPVIGTEVLLEINRGSNAEYENLILVRDGIYSYAFAVHEIAGHRQLYLNDSEKFIETKQTNRKFTLGAYEAQIALLNMREMFKFLNAQTLN